MIGAGRRPMGVAAIAALHWIMAAVAVVTTFASIRTGAVSILLWLATFVVAGLLVAIGIGLWRLSRAGFFGAIALHGLFAGHLLRFVATSGLRDVRAIPPFDLVSLAILVYLLLPAVRNSFR